MYQRLQRIVSATPIYRRRPAVFIGTDALVVVVVADVVVVVVVGGANNPTSVWLAHVWKTASEGASKSTHPPALISGTHSVDN